MAVTPHIIDFKIWVKKEGCDKMTTNFHIISFKFEQIWVKKEGLVIKTIVSFHMVGFKFE